MRAKARRAWARRVNGALRRSHRNLCGNMMDEFLEIREGVRGMGVFVRAGVVIPQGTPLGFYWGEFAGRNTQEGAYVLSMPAFRAGGYDGPLVRWEVNGRPYPRRRPWRVTDAALYNHMCTGWSVEMCWLVPVAGGPSVMEAKALRHLYGGEELTWSYGTSGDYFVDPQVARRMRSRGEPVVRCGCRAPRECPFDRWIAA